jgi:energy-converting hydrogenase Eha subunit E
MGIGELLIVLLYLSALALIVWWMAKILTTLQAIATILRDIAQKSERS